MRAAARLTSVTAAVLLCAACGGSSSSGSPAPGASASPVATADSALPAPDWHWESFRNVEAAVPPGWAHGTGDVAAVQWCISDTTYAAPYVIRPGIPAEADACPPDNPAPPVDPAFLVAKAGSFVSFTDTTSKSVKDGLIGDRQTRTEGSVVIRVQADQATRDKIVGSIRRISTDANGCAVTDPISTDPGARPTPGVAVATLKDVIKVVACRYSLIGPALGTSPTASPSPGPAGPLSAAATLLSSVTVTGSVAADTVHAMGDSAVGGGPNSEQNCPSDAGRGTEAIVLHITSASGASAVYLRYGGCNGLDDGLVQRVLTRRAVSPYVTGANLIPEYGDVLGGILDDPDAPATSGDPSDAKNGN
jgi:hypothetical protein